MSSDQANPQAPALEAFAMNGNMWPGASNEAVLPELTAAQKAVFGRLNSAVGQVFFGGNMFNGQGVEIDDVDLDTTDRGQDGKPDEAFIVIVDGCFPE